MTKVLYMFYATRTYFKTGGTKHSTIHTRHINPQLPCLNDIIRMGDDSLHQGRIRIEQDQIPSGRCLVVVDYVVGG